MTQPPVPEAPDDARWQAVAQRDPAADGTFWYGVRRTKIYCRPSCPSRRPLRPNVTFFESPEAAQAAGYRACQRCAADRVGAVATALARAQHLLDTEPAAPSLKALAAAVGFSPFHLQRVFKAHFGVSPKQYALRARTERLKTHLGAGQSVTAALYAAGHDSPATLYAPATDQLGMAPRAYARGGQGVQVRYAVVTGPLGPMLVAATARGLCAVRFGEPSALQAELRAEYPHATLTEDPATLAPYTEGLQAFLAGRPLPAYPTDLPGTAFQQRVWAALRQIPPGETRTYAQLAALIGQPGAVRAVARACAANPVALVVPCHRIVPKAGTGSGGYRWGAARKAQLLALEGALAPPF
ncbi:bifunctional transcriptional activator/DNA repair enzyme AdaA [Deinococcus aquaedulcis]|uniref:bifunctional transcriptional activator/DNA repair enzyme AdaA n=1 Tax=Deinococcus aquaedulcis TaxID=2840455 RepID=UPI001C83A049|nr:methylated-DNA--[protein]-cysteine S-methyltransferase [Deinococcus aquaedulcis]